jgi:hypothetical protein
VKTHEFELAIGRGVRVFNLEGAGKSLQAVVKQIQKENTRERITHIEFHVPTPVDTKTKPAKSVDSDTTCIIPTMMIEEALSPTTV